MSRITIIAEKVGRPDYDSERFGERLTFYGRCLLDAVLEDVASGLANYDPAHLEKIFQDIIRHYEKNPDHAQEINHTIKFIKHRFPRYATEVPSEEPAHPDGHQDPIDRLMTRFHQVLQAKAARQKT